MNQNIGQTEKKFSTLNEILTSDYLLAAVMVLLVIAEVIILKMQVN